VAATPINDAGNKSTTPPRWIAAGARRDDGQDAWVLGPNLLVITRNGGGRWSRLSLPVEADTVRAAAVLPNKVVAIARSHATEGVGIDTRTRQGWERQTVRLGMPVGNAEIVDDHGTLVGAIIDKQTSAQFSEARWLSAPAAGVGWRMHAAPAASSVSDLDGTLWLVGGTAHSLVYRSTDDGASWTKIAIPASPKLSRSRTLSPAEAGPRGPVLVATGGRLSELIVGSSSAGTPFDNGPILRLGGYGVDGNISTASGVLWAMSPRRKIARVALKGNRVTVVQAHGLPANSSTSIYAVSARRALAFQSGDGCSHNKKNCREQQGIFATDDGGRSWRPAPNPLG
jgi:hypothetical protein